MTNIEIKERIKIILDCLDELYRLTDLLYGEPFPVCVEQTISMFEDKIKYLKIEHYDNQG